MPCIFGCADQTPLKGRKEHLQHAENVCNMVLVVCHNCNTKTLKRNFADHDCLMGLIERVDGKDSHTIIKALREINLRSIDRYHRQNNRF